jgi:hypothetical protein
MLAEKTTDPALAFATRQRGNTNNTTPKKGKMTRTKKLANAFEKTLEKKGKTVDDEHGTPYRRKTLQNGVNFLLCKYYKISDFYARSI